MKSFQILGKDKKAIPLSILDIEAAKLWKKEINSKSYVTPTPVYDNPNNLKGAELRRAIYKHMQFEQMSWYDLIGWKITQVEKHECNWNSIVKSILSSAIGDKFISEKDSKIQISYFEEKDDNLVIPEAIEIQIYHVLEYYRPYVDLINHWIELGYTPLQIEE